VIRVLLAEDHALVLEALKARLGRDPGIRVVGAVDNGADLVDEYMELLPDVVVSDIDMPEMTGIEAVVKVRQTHPTARVLFLSGLDDQETIAKAVNAGASGFMVKTVHPRELCECVRKVARGELVFDQAATKVLMAEVRNPHALAQLDHTSPLSARELEILQLVADDLTNAEIAEALYISPLTVKTHVERILAKLGVRGRVGAVREGIARGMLG
jgi:DNA-binding NarL/FixJ family response regulator